MKRAITCGLVLLLLNMTQGFAQQEADFEWYEDDWLGGIVITSYAGTSRDVTIPPMINGMPVVGIGESVFAGKRLTSVAIPGSVTFVEKWAFEENHLTMVTIPEGVEEIREGAFGDNQLASITIPQSVRWIESLAFYGNPITSITIWADVELWESKAEEESSGILGQDRSFDEAYNKGGKLAGTYTRPDAQSTVWTRQ